MEGLPKGFIELEEGSRRILAKEAYLPYLREKGLLDPRSLFRGLDQGGPLRGRGSLLVVEGEVALVVRRYLHGGLLRAFNEDLFLFGDRPFQELLITEGLRQRGVRTLEPVAAIREGVGPFYRGYLITRYLPRVVDLITYLRGRPPLGQKRTIIRKAAELTRMVHDLGVLHGDLHLKNFLVEDGEVLIIDFDRATRHPSLNPAMRMENLKRLDRSAEKLRRRGLPLSDADKLTFWRTYARGRRNLEEALRGHLKRYRLRVLLWRLGWTLEERLYGRAGG